jgi:hypothetical protein
MKAFGDASFFRLFNSLVAEAGTGMGVFAWTHCGIQWVRNRHTFGHQLYSFGTDTFLLTRPGARSWSLLVVKEFWQDTSGTSLRSGQWAKPLLGRKTDIRHWIQQEEKRLRDATSKLSTPNDS